MQSCNVIPHLPTGLICKVQTNVNVSYNINFILDLNDILYPTSATNAMQKLGFIHRII